MNSTTAFCSGVSVWFKRSTSSVCARSIASFVRVVGGGSARNWFADSSAKGFILNQCGVRKPGVSFVPSARVNVIGCQRSGSSQRSHVLTG